MNTKEYIADIAETKEPRNVLGLNDVRNNEC